MSGRCLAALVVFAVSAAVGCQTDARVSITPVRCEVLHQDGRCELMDSGLLRLHVAADHPFQRVIVRQGRRELPPKVLSQASDREQLIEIHADPATLGTAGLTVRVGFSMFQWAEVTLPVRARQEADWLRQARLTWDGNKVDQARDLLRQALDSGRSMSAQDRALAHGMMGRIERDLGHREQAQAFLEQALAEDQGAGLVFNQINDTLSLAYMAMKEQHLDRAKQLLKTLTPALERMPEMQAFVWLQHALLARFRGDLKMMLVDLDECTEFATRYQDGEALSECHALAGDVFAWLGQYEEAMDRKQKARLALESIVEQSEPCRSATRLIDEGRLLMGVRQFLQGYPDETDSREWLKRDPRKPLQDALKLAQAQCTQSDLMAEIYTELARAALLDHRFDEAERRLREAEATGAKRESDGTELRGQLALGRGEYARALAEFRSLLQLAEGRDPHEDWFETRWRAWTGMARAQEMTDTTAALEAYGEAERMLDAWSLYLPLGSGRTSFFGRHSLETGRHLALLVLQRHHVEALRLIRKNRLRGYQAYHRATRLSALSPARRLEWEQKLKDYRAADHAWSDNHIKLTQKTFPLDELEKGREQDRSLERKLWEFTEEALRHLGAPKEKAPPELEPGEVLLACQPVPDSWLCLAASGAAERDVQPVRLPRRDGVDDAETFGMQLLDALQEKLHHARRLRVLAGGMLDRIDLHRLPFEGAPLERHLTVVYSFDLPRHRDGATAPPTRRPEQALVLINRHRLTPALSIAEQLEADLAAELRPHYEVTMVPHVVVRSGWWPWTKPARAAEPMDLHTALSQSDLFVYLGHAIFDAKERLPPRLLTDDAGFKVSDILLLDRAPRGVVLAGCETGRSGSADPSRRGGDVGLAQAFLLRGSEWVIATARPVAVGVAADLSRALFAQGLLIGPGVDAAAALHQAREWVRHHPQDSAEAPYITPAVREKSLDAFRAFVP